MTIISGPGGGVRLEATDTQERQTSCASAQGAAATRANAARCAGATLDVRARSGRRSNRSTFDCERSQLLPFGPLCWPLWPRGAKASCQKCLMMLAAAATCAIYSGLLLRLDRSISAARRGQATGRLHALNSVLMTSDPWPTPNFGCRATTGKSLTVP